MPKTIGDPLSELDVSTQGVHGTLQHTVFLHQTTVPLEHHDSLFFFKAVFGDIVFIIFLLVVFKISLSGIIREYRISVCKKHLRQGLLLSNRHHEIEALAVLDEVIRKFWEAKDWVIKNYVAQILIKKGDIFLDLHREQEAEASFQEVIGRFATEKSPSLQKWVEKAQQKLAQQRTIISHCTETEQV